MGLFAIDVMSSSGAHPLLVIAAPNETEAIAVCEMQRKLGDIEYREVFGEGTFIARRPSEDERQEWERQVNLAIVSGELTSEQDAYDGNFIVILETPTAEA